MITVLLMTSRGRTPDTTLIDDLLRSSLVTLQSNNLLRERPEKECLYLDKCLDANSVAIYSEFITL